MAPRKERKLFLLLLLIGGSYLAYNTKYSLDSWNNPGPAVFPLIVGVSFIFLSAWQFALTFWRPVGGFEEDRQTPLGKFFFHGRAETRPFLLVVVFLIDLLLMKTIGFFPSSFVFVVATSRLLGARDWIRPLGLGGGIDLFCYLLFEVWLKLSLPKGSLF